MKQFILFAIVLIIGCTTGSTALLRLQDRELLIHPDKAALAFPHKVSICKKRPWALRWLGKKCHKEQEMTIYDMTLKSDREKLINAGFTCKSAMRFKY